MITLVSIYLSLISVLLYLYLIAPFVMFVFPAKYNRHKKIYYAIMMCMLTIVLLMTITLIWI